MSKDLQELQGKFDRTYDYLRVGTKSRGLNSTRVLTLSNPLIPSGWQTLDLSSYLSEGTTDVYLSLYLYAPGNDCFFAVSPVGGSDYYQLIVYGASEITYPISNAGRIKCAADRTIQYICSTTSAVNIAIYLGAYEVPILQGG